MRAFLRALKNALTAPWVLALALMSFFVLLVWFLGPYIAIAEHKVLESVISRLIATLVLVFLWGLFVAIFYSRRRRKELADPEKAAAAEQRHELSYGKSVTTSGTKSKMLSALSRIQISTAEVAGHAIVCPGFSSSARKTVVRPRSCLIPVYSFRLMSRRIAISIS